MNVHTKVQAGGLGMMVMTLVSAILTAHHVVLDPTVTLAAAGVITFVIQYFVPNVDTSAPITVDPK